MKFRAFLGVIIIISVLFLLNPPIELLGYDASVDNYGLFSIAHTRSFKIYLGLLGRWFRLPRTVPCRNGFDVGGTCVCFLSWTGRYCHLPLRGSVSLWKGWIYPFLYTLIANLNMDPFRIFWETDCILGVPVVHLPPGLVVLGRMLKLDNVLDRIGMLEVLFLAHLILFLVGQYSWTNDRVGWYYRTFACQRPYKPHTYITSSFVHPGILGFLVDMYAFVLNAPALYSRMGDLYFVWFYITACISCAFFSVRFYRDHAGSSGVNLAILVALVLSGYNITSREVLIFIWCQILTGSINIGEWIGAGTACGLFYLYNMI